MANCLTCNNYLECRKCAGKEVALTPYANSWIATVDALKRSMFSPTNSWGEYFDPNDFLSHLAGNGFITDDDYYRIHGIPERRRRQMVCTIHLRKDNSRLQHK